MKKFAAVCVFATAGIALVAQQPPAKKTPPKTGVHKPVVIKKTTVTTTKTVKKVTTTTIVAPQAHAKKTAKRVAVRHRRRRRRYARHYRRTVRRVAIVTYSGGAETGLVGIRLFDSGMRVLALYGNPDMILTLGQTPTTTSVPGGGGAPNFGGGAGRGAGFAPGGPNGAPRGRGGPHTPGLAPMGDISGGDSGLVDSTTLDQATFGPPSYGPGGQGAPPSGAVGPRGRGNFGGGAGFMGGRGLPPVGGGIGGGGNNPGFPGGTVATGQAENPQYVRWLYKKGPSQYSFIIDKQDRVVQIEAVGMGDSRVHTNKGVTFGATFKELMDRYGDPDAYEINGDSLILRYLSKHNVAFRLNRLQTDHAHEVTAIVVAGGKG